MLQTLIAAFVVVFLAELGDKSQILALTFATRYRAVNTLIGLTIATALMMTIAVGAGVLVGDRLNPRDLSLVAGMVFIGFAIWTLLEPSLADEAAEAARLTGGSRTRTVFGIAAAFALAEFGDKTMLATIALAAKQPPVAVWIGAFTGMLVGDGLAVVLGDKLGQMVSPKAIRFGSAAAFGIIGLALLIEGLR
jgi:putative Ca2+/H+ antiporter (TMEM165/GDT1 family)